MGMWCNLYALMDSGGDDGEILEAVLAAGSRSGVKVRSNRHVVIILCDMRADYVTCDMRAIIRWSSSQDQPVATVGNHKVIGAIGGSHIPIPALTASFDPQSYINRKRFYSRVLAELPVIHQLHQPHTEAAMKLFSLSVLFKSSHSARALKAAHDLQSFGFFQRGSVQEFMVFSSKVLVERSHCGARQSVREQDYMCHVYVRPDGLAAVLVSDHEYPKRVAHALLDRVLDEFSEHVPSDTWPSASPETVRFTGLEATLARYQNPREADAMTKIQSELDETKIILHNTIESVLERGEKLDDLVAKSEDLSMQSKTFYKTARKTNSCCNFG